jgi:hypothetical protein
VVKDGGFWSALCAKKSAFAPTSGHSGLPRMPIVFAYRRDAMLRHRIIAGSAACLFVVATTAGAAVAQTADDSAGRPLQLLQNIKPAKTATQSTVSTRKTRTAAKNHFRPHTRLAAKRHHVVQVAQTTTPPENMLPAAPATSVAEAVPTPPPSLEPVSPSALPQPSELVVGGQEVRVAASPDVVNEIDLAANNAPSAPVENAQPTTVTTTAAQIGNSVEATPKADAVSIAVARQQPDSQDRSSVGSTSWVMQVLAALGGAVAAGSVAWFLIGSAPQRTYG